VRAASVRHASKGPHLLLGSTLLLASSCGGDATSEPQGAAGAATAGDTWGEQIRAAVRYRAPWPVDLVLSFEPDYRGTLRFVGEIQPGDLLRLEIGGDRSARDELRWLFEWVDLQFDVGQPLRADQQAFAGVAWLRNGLAYSFPQFLLADSSGRPYATTPRLEIGGGWAWARTVAHLQDVRVRRDEHLDRAAHLAGIERARELAAGLDVLEELLVTSSYQPEMREIVALDADGSAGLQRRFEQLLQWAAGQHAIADLQWALHDCFDFTVNHREGTLEVAARDVAALHEVSRRIAAANWGNPLVRQFARAVDACSSYGYEPFEQTRRRLDAVLQETEHPRIADLVQRLRDLLETVRPTNPK